MWKLYAVLSAVFAALTAILAKKGVDGVVSGIATGLSWLFYFKALQGGPASLVAPIDKLSVAITIVLGIVLLGEHPGWRGIAGGALILAGSLVILLPGK